MIREVKNGNKTIKYELTRKKVKNINLRVKPDFTVAVSAPSRVSLRYLDEFVLSKADFINSAIEEYKNKTVARLEPRYTPEEFTALIKRYFDEVYTKFIPYNIDRPQLRLKRMKSRWGSCNFVKRVIALSTNLIYCTEEQIYYVVVHEFTHLLVHNHSKAFYDIVSVFCPDYKRIRREMNSIMLE